jgi:hypothetical protein
MVSMDHEEGGEDDDFRMWMRLEVRMMNQDGVSMMNQDGGEMLAGNVW